MIEHVAEAPVPLRLHAPDELNVPAPLLVKPTIPEGVVEPDEEASVTVAVQVVAVLTGIVPGTHDMLVVVGCSGGGVTVKSNLPELVE